jgi:hypothetical protein
LRAMCGARAGRRIRSCESPHYGFPDLTTTASAGHLIRWCLERFGLMSDPGAAAPRFFAPCAVLTFTLLRSKA